MYKRGDTLKVQKGLFPPGTSKAFRERIKRLLRVIEGRVIGGPPNGMFKMGVQFNNAPAAISNLEFLGNRTSKGRKLVIAKLKDQTPERHCQYVTLIRWDRLIICKDSVTGKRAPIRPRIIAKPKR